MKKPSHNPDLTEVLIIIYTFVDDFFKNVINSIGFALEKVEVTQNKPPTKKPSLSLAEVVTLSIFRFYTGHRTWKDFYKHIKHYHAQDFPRLPSYQNFIRQVNRASVVAVIMSKIICKFFLDLTPESDPKFVDSTKLEVCGIKREFSHKVCKGLAKKSKSTMGWFYGFKLHVICNQWMQILDFRITPGNVDDRDGLEMIWADVLGTIVADAGYLGKERQEKAQTLGKHLFAAARANMKKLMTKTQHELLKMRQCVETVFAVLKQRFGLVNTLPRSPLGHFAYYCWAILAYQINKLFEVLFYTTSRLT